MKWIPLIAIVLSLISLGERFYSRFYPEVETQKKHLKQAFGWGIDFVAIGTQLWAIRVLFRAPLPTTNASLVWLVIQLCFAIDAIIFLIGFRVGGYFLSRVLGLLERHLNNTGRMIEIVKSHNKGLALVSTSSAVEPEIRASLDKLLTENG